MLPARTPHWFEQENFLSDGPPALYSPGEEGGGHSDVAAIMRDWPEIYAERCDLFDPFYTSRRSEQL